jgi:hypothetical protein
MPARRTAFGASACLLLTGGLALPAQAWEHTAEWRFAGSEIASFRAIQPQYNEDPMVLEVLLASDVSGPAEILIEADNWVSPDCLDLLGNAQGNPNITVVLTANLNAQTMNGVTLAQCSAR